MVSLRGDQNEEPWLAVGIDQHLPPNRIHARWRRTRVVPGECHGKGPAPRLFKSQGAAFSVVTVRVHAACHRHAGGVEHRGDRSGHGTDVRLRLAEVVNEGCLDRSAVVRKDCRHTPSDVDGVPLIWSALEPEQLGTLAMEVFVDETLIVGAWSRSADMPEESPDEVADLVEAVGHEAACLHPMQRRTAGRYPMRSAPICMPHVSQIP